MDCNYAISLDKCVRPAKYVIIWGCLENHIGEFVVCAQHLHQWVNAYHIGHIACAYCYNPSADYVTCHFSELKPNAELHL